MNRLKTGLILLVVLGIAAVVLIFKNMSNNTMKGELRDFAYEDTASVSKIFLADKKGHTVLLKKGENKVWMMNDTLPARVDLVNVLLSTVKDVKVLAPVPKTMHNTVIRDMSAIATKIEVYAKCYRINIFNFIKFWSYDKKVKTYYVGDATQDMQGTFMCMEGSTIPFITYIPSMRGYLSTRYTANPRDWRDKVVFEYMLDEIKSIKIENYKLPEESFEITRASKKQFSIKSLNGKPLQGQVDTTMMLDFVTGFYKVNFEEFVHESELTPKQIDSTKKTTPFIVITVTNNLGQKNVVKTYIRTTGMEEKTDETGKISNIPALDPDRLFASVNNGKDFVLIQYFVFDKLFLRLSDFYVRGAAAKEEKK